MAKAIAKTANPKKEYKKEVAAKMESAFTDLKEKLGDKEFQHRIKKATKILAHGLHLNKDASQKNVATAKAAPPVKKAKSLKKIAKTAKKLLPKKSSKA